MCILIDWNVLGLGSIGRFLHRLGGWAGVVLFLHYWTQTVLIDVYVEFEVRRLSRHWVGREKKEKKVSA
jgi:hypothetical protein